MAVRSASLKLFLEGRDACLRGLNVARQCRVLVLECMYVSEPVSAFLTEYLRRRRGAKLEYAGYIRSRAASASRKRTIALSLDAVTPHAGLNSALGRVDEDRASRSVAVWIGIFDLCVLWHIGCGSRSALPSALLCRWRLLFGFDDWKGFRGRGG